MLDRAKNIDEYIAAAPADVQPILRKIRKTISAAAPDAQEIISYRMPGSGTGDYPQIVLMTPGQAI
jgi:uncharacterized protein YdhG (YjbR/CyaY superfamily)